LNKNGYQQDGINQRQKVRSFEKKHQRNGGDTKDLKTDQNGQQFVIPKG